MSAATRYWRVVFAASGTVETITELVGPPNADWVIVEAATEEAARRAAIRLYSASNTRETRARLKAEGRCRCGRPRDKKRKDGTLHDQCSVCAERNKSYDKSTRRPAPTPSAPASAHEPKVRDEAARVAVNLERQRDRRGELRIEVLLEVRKHWQESLTVGHFTKWLEAEIAALTKKGVAA